MWSPSSTENAANTANAATTVYAASAAARESTAVSCACRPAPDEPLPPLPDPDSWQVRRRRGIWRHAALRRGGITTVVLDIGGVIIPSLFESVALDGFPRGPLADEPEYRPVITGASAERAYWAEVVARHPQWDIARLWRECSWIRTEMATAIAILLSRLRVVLFTNDMGHFFGTDWLERAEFAPLRRLDAVVESAALGVAKPDPGAYRRALPLIGDEARRCLFVDDHEANLRGAETVGMHTHLFDIRDPVGSTESLLDRLGMPRAEPRHVFRI